VLESVFVFACNVSSTWVGQPPQATVRTALIFARYLDWSRLELEPTRIGANTRDGVDRLLAKLLRQPHSFAGIETVEKFS
jgi:hypothetical protein